MKNLPDISQEKNSLTILKNKLQAINDIEIDYNSKDLKNHYKTMKKLENFIEKIEEIIKIYTECEELQKIEKTDEIYDLAMEEYEIQYSKLEEKRESLFINIALANEKNSDEIILEIRAGTGGDEASLFASEMLKLYSKSCEDNKWSFEVVDLSRNELGGIKNCSISICGKDVYKYFQFESGVHRVQRVPQTEVNGRIHTSTITVAILCCDEDVIDIEVNPNDLKVDTYRASGAGGQHVNKTDSAVRLTHLPSGIVTQCQEERSQIKNREKAMKILKSKLYELEKQKKQEAMNIVRDKHIGTGDRSEKSRTYNYPQNRITDHIFNITLYQLDVIMSGNFQILYNKVFEEYQKKKLEEKASKMDFSDL